MRYISERAGTMGCMERRSSTALFRNCVKSWDATANDGRRGERFRSRSCSTWHGSWCFLGCTTRVVSRLAGLSSGCREINLMARQMEAESQAMGKGRLSVRIRHPHTQTHEKTHVCRASTSTELVHTLMDYRTETKPPTQKWIYARTGCALNAPTP